MPKPSDTFTWATDANFASGPRSGQPTKVDPSTDAAQGVVAGLTYPTEWVNYVLNNTGEWINWLDATVADEVDDIGLAVYGDGSAGTATISTQVALTADTYYENLTISGTGELITAGFRLFVQDTLTVESGGLIHFDGEDGSGATGGTNSPGGPLGIGGAGGDDGVAGDSVATSLGGNGGAGGEEAFAAGFGAAGTRSLPGAALGGYRHWSSTLGHLQNPGDQDYKIAGGAGGGGGGSNGDLATLGGGGGAGGNVVVISARTLINEGTISANGGDGDDGNTGSGGGGGGGGGVIITVSRNRSGGGTYSVAGGAGGTGGTGATTDDNGAAGSAGTIIHLTM